MIVRKITIDNSARYFPITEKTRERDIKQKPIKAVSLLRKQNKNISQNNKKFLENVAAQRFGLLTKQYS